MQGSQDFDRSVGRVAGAIFSDISSNFPYPPLMLVPGITLKVRRVLEKTASLKEMSPDTLESTAQNIRVALIPLLYSLDVDSFIIENIAPDIENSARRVLLSLVKGDPS